MTKAETKVSLARARAFILHRQMLSDGSASGTANVLQVLGRLGYVQIDTINVVERAHHHTLWSRAAGYRPDMLGELQKGGKVFEYWAHAMCYLPMADYRFYRRHMAEFPDRSRWYQGYYKKYGRLAEEVLARIKAEGPLSAADFEAPKRRKRQGWWDWKPAKTALEMLFYRGDLMVADRRGFQRVYDLTPRVLPKGIDASLPGEKEARRFFVRRALSAMGLAAEGDIGKYIAVGGKPGAVLAEMEKNKEVIRVQITGLAKPQFALAELLDEMEGKPSPGEGVKLLSPFDNAVILRQRTRDLFGLDFSMECYLPHNKRKYGYFSLPILWRNVLVGRLDPKADREAGALVVRSLHLERRQPESFFSELAAELERYADFNRCGSIKLEGPRAESVKKLAKHL